VTYSKTVKTFPEAIFVLAAFLLFSAVLLLSRVQPDEEEVAHAHAHSRQSTARLSHYDYESIATTEETAVADDVCEDSDEERRFHERTLSNVSTQAFP
jgi:hypothetical protein